MDNEAVGVVKQTDRFREVRVPVTMFTNGNADRVVAHTPTPGAGGGDGFAVYLEVESGHGFYLTKAAATKLGEFITEVAEAAPDPAPAPDYEARRAAWTAALRSGAFKQGRSRLHQQDEYCCLGVACTQVADLPSREMGYNGVVGYGLNESTNILPPEAQEYLRLTSKDGTFQFRSLSPDWQEVIISQLVRADELGIDVLATIARGGGSARVSLADLNDAGVPFRMIADIIDARPDGLFTEETA